MAVHGKTKSEKFLTLHNVVNHVSKFLGNMGQALTEILDPHLPEAL